MLARIGIMHAGRAHPTRNVVRRPKRAKAYRVDHDVCPKRIGAPMAGAAKANLLV